MKATPMRDVIGGRGLKPGQVHSGSFKPGHDPRRWTGGGKPHKQKQAFQELVRAAAPKAVDFLISCVSDDKAPMKERRAAAEALINHGFGMPVSRVLQAQVDGTDRPQSAVRELLDYIKAANQKAIAGEVVKEVEFNQSDRHLT